MGLLLGGKVGRWRFVHSGAAGVPKTVFPGLPTASLASVVRVTAFGGPEPLATSPPSGGAKMGDMITGVHAIVYAEDPDRARAFCRDVLKWPHVDAHGGWLIFKLPPGELGVHPTDPGASGRHELYLMCEDIKAEMASLAPREWSSSRRWRNRDSDCLPGFASRAEANSASISPGIQLRTVWPAQPPGEPGVQGHAAHGVVIAGRTCRIRGGMA